MTPALVVIAYNRPIALKRLLVSLDAASYPEGADVPLVISIDRGPGGSDEAVCAVARAFEWRFGTKQVIEQPLRLGLVGHFRECGRMSQRFDGVVLLEDDLTVAPPFYAFAGQALSCYADDDRIGGVCLYGLWFNGFTREPFEPLADGADAFFLGLPYTQGLAFTAAQWAAFDSWWQDGAALDSPGLHPAFLRFGQDEWFPALAAYTAGRQRYFCFPRVSLTVAWGDAGSHFDAATGWLQAPVQLRGESYRLYPFDESLAVYDAFFELLPDRLRSLAPHLPGLDFDVDLNATKQPVNLRHEYVLTTRPAKRALARYGLRMRPPELNVVAATDGAAIALAHRDDVGWGAWAGREARRRVSQHAWSRYRPSRRRSLGFALARFMNWLRGKKRH
jgi:hypothetical protein